MSQSRIIGAVEIGASKVVALVAEVTQGRSMNIIGMAQGASAGLQKGEITDFRAVSNCTHKAIAAAEKSAGEQIESAYLALSGGHLEGFRKVGSANVSGSDNVVRRVDVERALLDGKSKELAPGRVYIHHIRNHFSIDGRVVAEPLGGDGSRLEVAYWSVHADERKVRDFIHVVNGYGISVEDVIVSSIASGTLVASPQAKQAGVLVVDVGGGTTDWALFQGGFISQTGVVPVGGDHLRNDLSLGLRVNAKYAAALLREHGKAKVEPADHHERVWMVGDQMIGDRRIPLESLVRICQVRLEELFGIIRKQLGESATRSAIPAGVMLTGGLARLPLIDQVAAQAMSLPVVIARNPRWVREDLRSPEFSTPLGLLQYAVHGSQRDGAGQERGGLLGRVARMFSV